jgi:hypothetical protein
MSDHRFYSARPDATSQVGVNPFLPKSDNGSFLSSAAELLKPDLSPIRNAFHDVGTMLGVNQDRYALTGVDAVSLAVMAIPGVKKLPFKRAAKGSVTQAEEITLSHFSKEARGKIDPKKIGSGYASEELRQGLPSKANAWSNWYLGGKPETGIAIQAPIRHDLTGKFNIIDLASAEAKPLIEKAQKRAFRSVGGNFNEQLAKTAKEEGYDGLMNSAATQSNNVRMFYPQTPTKIIRVK